MSLTEDLEAKLKNLLLSGISMWFSAIKLALNAGTHIYKKRQETKMAMADAQHMHAAKMARGEEA